jgi:predicted PurR-regulated permease PerM
MDHQWERSRYAWALGGLVLAGVLLYVAYSFIGTLVFGVFIYYASRPVQRRLLRRFDSRMLASAVALTVVVLPILLLLGYTVAIGLQEFSRLADTVDLGMYEEMLAPYIDIAEVVENPGSLLQDPNITDSVRPVLAATLGSLGFVGNGLLHLFIMLALAYYLLQDGPKLRRWFERRFADADGVLTSYATAVDRDLYRVFSGNIYNALFTGALGAMVYSTLDLVAPTGAGIPYPALVGLLAGAASLVPVVGMKLVYIPVGAYLFGSQFLSADPVYWVPTAFVLLSFVVVDTIPDFIVRPMVSGTTPNVTYSRRPPFVNVSLAGEGGLHVGMIMFAYILGPILFGWYGLFLGPMILVVVVHFAGVVLPELLSGTRIQPFAVDPSNVTVAEPPHDPTPPAENVGSGGSGSGTPDTGSGGD